MSQCVMHTLRSSADLVPVLIKIQQLQKLLLNEEHHATFGRAWNWVDAYFSCVHGADSLLYRFLRQERSHVDWLCHERSQA